MNRAVLGACAGAFAVLAAGSGRASSPEPLASPAPPSVQGAGYLAAGGAPDPVRVLAPPPAPGSPEDVADHQIIHKTRALQGGPRWSLAARDAVDFTGAFDCALGRRLTRETTPRTRELLLRVGRDAAALVDRAKDHFTRPRPFVGSDLPICVEDQRAKLARSYSYPSGHATFAAAAGLILAELVPERATPILARARSFAESRVVCGVHYPSDIAAGEAEGAALVAALHADPRFRADLEAARAELAPAAAPPATAADPESCVLEASAAEHTPWINPERPK